MTIPPLRLLYHQRGARYSALCLPVCRLFLARHFHITAKRHAMRTAKYPLTARPNASNGKPTRNGLPSIASQFHISPPQLCQCSSGNDNTSISVPFSVSLTHEPSSLSRT